MTQPSQLIATLRMRLPGAGTDALMSELSNTMQEFCVNTAAWRCDVERNILADKSTYDLQLTDSGEIFEIIRVTVGLNVYQPLSVDNPRNNVSAGFTGYRVSRECPSVIQLYPTPREDRPKDLKVVVAMRPKMGTIDMPLAIVERYHEAILEGALGRMMMHPSKPYTNMEQGRLYERKYRAAVTNTRRIVRGSDSQASPAWTFPQQAPARTRRGARSYGGR